MIVFNFDLAFDDSEYPGLRIGGTFIELAKYLEKLAEVVPYTKDQELIRFKAAIEKQARTLTAEDLQEKIEEVRWIAKDLVPRFFMGAFIIALAAAYESAITDVANYIRAKTKARLKIDDLREANTYKRIDLYFETVIGSGYKLAPELAARMEQLNNVRNCLAHANGNLLAQNEHRRKSLEALAKSNCGAAIRSNALVIEESFARSYLAYAAEAVNSLLDQVHKKYASPQA